MPKSFGFASPGLLECFARFLGKLRVTHPSSLDVNPNLLHLSIFSTSIEKHLAIRFSAAITRETSIGHKGSENRIASPSEPFAVGYVYPHNHHKQGSKQAIE